MTEPNQVPSPPKGEPPLPTIAIANPDLLAATVVMLNNLLHELTRSGAIRDNGFSEHLLDISLGLQESHPGVADFLKHYAHFARSATPSARPSSKPPR